MRHGFGNSLSDLRRSRPYQTIPHRLTATTLAYLRREWDWRGPACARCVLSTTTEQHDLPREAGTKSLATPGTIEVCSDRDHKEAAASREHGRRVLCGAWVRILRTALSLARADTVLTLVQSNHGSRSTVWDANVRDTVIVSHLALRLVCTPDIHFITPSWQ